MTAIAHRMPDRVPVDYWVRSDVTRRLMAHVGVDAEEALFRLLQIDLRPVRVGEHATAFEARTDTVVGGASERTGRRFIARENGAFEDAWGVVRRQGSDGRYEQWVSGPFVDTKDLDRFAWPEGDIFEPVEAIKARIEAYGGEFATLGHANLPFKIAWHMRGFENFLCDMMTDRPFARALLQRIADYEFRRCLRQVEAGVDIIGFFGDLAMQDRLLVHPGSWRETEKPILADLVRRLRAVNPDLIVFFHSDGDISEIIPDYVDIGADVINPIQPECMDPVAVKRTWGDRIALHGTISIQRTLPNGTPDDVRKEVRERIRTCGANGGLIICPSNVVQNDTPLENILALYDPDLRD